MIYYFTPIQVIAGTTVEVSTGTSITYAELLNELQTQPYIITYVNVYTDSQAQSTQRLRKTQKEANGLSLVDFKRPKLDPMQRQFAIENIETNFTPSPLNALNYNLKGNQSVRIWLYYNRIDMSEITEDKFKELENPKPKEMIVRESINPVFDLLGITNVKKINIKEDIKKNIVLRDDVTDEEIYNSFDGLDYNEL